MGEPHHPRQLSGALSCALMRLNDIMDVFERHLVRCRPRIGPQHD